LITELLSLGELTHSLTLSKPKLVFVSAYASQLTIAVCKKLGFVQKIVLIDGKQTDGDDNFVIGMDALIKLHANEEFNVEEHTKQVIDTKNQVALVLCSSGTTGLPKGVETTQDNMITCIHAYREFFNMLRTAFGSCVAYNVAPWQVDSIHITNIRLFLFIVGFMCWASFRCSYLPAQKMQFLCSRPNLRKKSFLVPLRSTRSTMSLSFHQ